MEQNQFYLSLLRIIKDSGNILLLKKAGLEYVQIFEMMKDMTRNGYATQETGKIRITDLGIQLIDELNDKLELKNSARWIDPEFRSQIEKINPDDLYLPRKNELTFLF